MFRTAGSIIGKRRFGKSTGAILALEVRRVAQAEIEKSCADLPVEILAKIKVKTYKNGVLTISCPQLVAAELYMRSEGLKKGINESIGRQIVNELRFRGRRS